MKPPLQTNRAFGLTFALFLGVICGVTGHLSGHCNVWLGGAAGLFFLLALVRPISLLLLNRIWHAVVTRVGVVSNYLILLVVFFLFITPLGWGMRIFGRDTMRQRAFQYPKFDTFFVPVVRHTTQETLRDIF